MGLLILGLVEPQVNVPDYQEKRTALKPEKPGLVFFFLLFGDKVSYLTLWSRLALNSVLLSQLPSAGIKDMYYRATPVSL